MNNSTEAMAEEAKRIINDPKNYDELTDTYTLPNGWAFCGAGAYRTALRAPDGLVYKVQHNSEDGLFQENAMEWEAYSIWAGTVEEITNGLVRLAKPIEFYTNSNVIVMEYEPCAANAMWFGFGWDEFFASVEVEKAIEKIMNETSITDIHSGNLYFNTNAELVIVDYTH